MRTIDEQGINTVISPPGQDRRNRTMHSLSDAELDLDDFLANELIESTSMDLAMLDC